MNGKQINFLINFECLFEIRALYISAIRVVNQKFKFTNSLKFNDNNQETSNLISSLKLENSLQIEVEKLILDNISTIKPKLFFILNILTLTKFLGNRINLSFHIYYDNNLLINESKHMDFISRTKKFINSYGAETVTIIKECLLLEEINNKKFNQGENYIIDFSINKLSKIITLLNNFTIFYKHSFKDNSNEDDDKFISLIKEKSLKFYENYDDFLKQFYNDEEYQNFKGYESSQMIFKFTSDHMNKEFSFLDFWKQTHMFKEPIKIKGKAVPGFQRGSSHLGVPTANIEMTNENIAITNHLLSGVYFGSCKFLSNQSGNQNINLDKTYKYVLSIGWNPYYENEIKTIEVFIIDYVGDTFYEEVLEIDINYFLRTEANFENFGELVTAITYDIVQANSMLSI